MKKTILIIAALCVISAGFAWAADEINASFGLNIRKGYMNLSVSESAQIDMTGDSFDHRTTTVTTNRASLTISGDIGTPGMAFFKNNSTNQTVMIGVTGESAFVKLLATEVWQGRIATNNISMWLPAASGTNTAALESIIIEE